MVVAAGSVVRGEVPDCCVIAGVPARVVIGYQGGEFNPKGRYFQVRQNDAHAWAEVWLEGMGWERVDLTQQLAPTRIYTVDMRVLTARFVNGRLDVPDGALHEGDVVTLILPDAEQVFELSEEERVQLLEAMARTGRGEGIDGWRLVEELKG